MLVSEFFRALSAELAFLGPRYAARRFDHPALAPYPTVGAVLAETEPRREKKRSYVTAEGSRLLCALIELYPPSRSRLWGALLIRAFRPMLQNVAKRLVGGLREDRFALLLESFHGAVLRVDPQRDPTRIAMYVRQEMRRAVFRALRAELAWQDVAYGEDADLCIDEVSARMRLLEGLPLRGPAGTGLTGAVLDADAAPEDVRGFVGRHYAALSDEEKAEVCQRLLTRRSVRLWGGARKSTTRSQILHDPHPLESAPYRVCTQ